VHHITDEELECEPTMTDLMSRRVSLLNIIKNADYVAGHFVDFDVRMLAQSGYVSAKPTVCTWKCARHMWPEAPAFGNQALRYWLNLNIPKMRHPPHRALTDAVVTAHILARMLATERTIDDLVTLTSAPVLLRTVSFGKYRGQTWLLRQDFGADERHTAEHWFKMTREEVDATGETGEVLQVRETAALDLPEETGRTAEGTVDGGPDIPEVPVHERVPRA
jgi:exodeoxyribonuclease X